MPVTAVCEKKNGENRKMISKEDDDESEEVEGEL